LTISALRGGAVNMKPIMRVWPAVPALMLIGLQLWPGGVGVASADELDRVRQLRDHDAILPLARILANVERRYPGALLDVELEEERGALIYEVKMLGHDHVMRSISVDARSGRILAAERE